MKLKSDQKFDLIAFCLAAVLHGGIFAWLVLHPPVPGRKRTVVEVEIRKPPPSPPMIVPPPEPERKLVKKVEKPPEAPRPVNKPPKVPPPQPPAPVFGLDKSATSDKGSFSVPLGNTTMANPQAPRPQVAPLPAASAPGGSEYHPLAEAELRAPPGHDADACFAGMKDKYSSSQAYTDGVEGEVVFRIELDAQGKIRGIRRVKGIGHGIDELAMGWLRFNPKCKFTPAIGKDGKPGAYVIERYSITFEIAR